MATDGTGPLVAFQVVVTQLIRLDERRLCKVSLVDEAQRRAIEAFLDHHSRVASTQRFTVQRR